MRILLLCNSRLGGGAERYTVAIARGLGQRGHTCYVAAPPASPTFTATSELPGITGLPFEAGPKLSRGTALDAALRWRRYRRRTAEFLTNVIDVFGIDLLHAQFKKEQLLATPAAAARGRPVVWTEHGYLPRLFAVTPFVLDRYRRAAAMTHRVLCVSRSVLQDLEAHGVPGHRLEVCNNGIDAGAVPGVAERAAVRSRLGLDDRDFVVGFTGRLASIKGSRILIHAADVLRARIPRLHVVLIGQGPERESLERLVAQLDLTRHVRFLGNRDDARDLLAAFDVFAAPSLSEGMPFAILEAMAAARPIIATHVGGIPEALADGDVGMLIEPGAAEPLVSGLDRLYRDAGLRARLGRAARARLVEQFSLEGMIDRTETAFLAAAGIRQAPSVPHAAKLAG